MAQIQDLPAPQPCDRRFLKEWLARPKGGANFLDGVEAEPWEEKNTADLITISPRSQRDIIATFIGNKFVPTYHRYIGQRIHSSSGGDLGPLWEYKNKSFVIFVNVMCLVLSSIIPTLSIFLLYYIQRMFTRLVILAMMNFVFSMVMMVIVGGRRADVYAASTAFAAVQVVFVGGINGMVNSR
jgi:hypothetical protein